MATELETRFPREITSRISLDERSLCSRGSTASLGAQLGATLATTSGKNGAAGAGTHACSETVGLRTAAVVWLKSALAHFFTPENLLGRSLDNLNNLRPKWKKVKNKIGFGGVFTSYTARLNNHRSDTPKRFD